MTVNVTFLQYTKIWKINQAENQKINNFYSISEHLSGKNLSDISGGALSCSSLLTARSVDDQLLLVSICVGAALCTGLLVFAAVHCSRQKVECRCGSCLGSLTGAGEDDGRGDISPSSTSSVSWKSKNSWRQILCCCCQVNYKLPNRLPILKQCYRIRPAELW